ncbi:MAG: DEAD/DEAH box helicase, partial [Proteobacteria bacterium]|nr:DEAD/DEAH box helicase [Pseudomonadota bacterium]
QAQAIPPLKAGRDLLGIAQTGTGKTAAFALPILERLFADPKPRPRKGARAVILAPTRELASQIAESFETYGRHLRPKVAVVFGGVGHRPQIDALARGLDILVATPGRLIDHMLGRAADLRSTEVLVLDEADQMLDLGFIKPIRQIVAAMPAERQNLLFSATMPREIAGLADQLLRDPVKVAVTPVSSTVERVSQRVIHVDASRKRALLAELLQDPALTRAIVFTRTKRGADRVAQHLEGHNIKVAAIHGNKSQRQREVALDAFREAKIRVLVATDIAARGIDIDEISHVINFELPDVPEAYVHRIGRTARAGASGTAISLCAGDERDQLRAIERTTRQSIPSEDRRGDQTLEADAARRGGGDRERRGRPEHGRQGGRERNGHGHGERRPHGGGERGGSRTGGGERRHEGRDRSEVRGDGSAPRHRPHERGEGRPERAGRPHGHGHGEHRGRSHGEHRARAENGNGSDLGHMRFMNRREENAERPAGESRDGRGPRRHRRGPRPQRPETAAG